MATCRYREVTRERPMRNRVLFMVKCEGYHATESVRSDPKRSHLCMRINNTGPNMLREHFYTWI